MRRDRYKAVRGLEERAVEVFAFYKNVAQAGKVMIIGSVRRIGRSSRFRISVSIRSTRIGRLGDLAAEPKARSKSRRISKIGIKGGGGGRNSGGGRCPPIVRFA